MPLLGKKVFSVGSDAFVNGSAAGDGDAPYLIPHTKERFQSKSEFEKRKNLYSQSIWTCRATGHLGLTHEEACNSETTVIGQLAENFPKVFEKDVLTIVHHNTISLESIVDKAWWRINQQFVVGETVNLKVKVADKLLLARIVSVDTSACGDSKPSDCNSPSSDKENSSDGKDKETVPKKWVPPKFLPYTYSIELLNDSKVVHSVPASDLQRTEKSPSKDLLRLFVRVSAVRPGKAATSPWVVNADLVTKYKLVNKFADLFFSPLKDADALKKIQENGKKRKMSNGTPGTAAKKLKLDKSDKKSKPAKDKTNSKKNKEKGLNKSSNSTPKALSPSKKSSKKTNEAVVVSSSDSEDDVSLAKLKQNGHSDAHVVLYRLAGETTPKKKKKKPSDDSSEEDIPLSKISKKSSSGTPKKNSSETKKKSSPTKKKDSKTSDGKKKEKKDKDGKKKTKDQKSPSKKSGGLKQVTLYDLTKKGKLLVSGEKTPTKKSPSKPKVPQTPVIVRRLLNMKQDSPKDKMIYRQMLNKALGILNQKQIKALPEKLRGEVEERKAKMEEKEKLEKMSPEEREAYLKEKKEKAKEIQKQKALERQREMNKRFEDLNLDLTPLPESRLVPTPDGFPNTLFGEVAAVTEFISCYNELLMPDSEYPIYTDALMKALVGGASGFTYLYRVLNVLLQTLLQDQIAKGCEELSTQLSDIAVSPYTASELVRLCVRNEDDEDEEDDNDVPEELVKQLEDTEFFELGVEQKLIILRGLCHRVLSTDAVQDYMQESQTKAGKLTKQKLLEMKEIAAAQKKEKEKLQNSVNSESKEKEKEKPAEQKKETEDSEKTGKDEKTEVDGSLSILSFYGKEAAQATEDDSKDWGSVVKSRRALAAKAAIEKERKERERAIQREKEYEEERERERNKKKSDQIEEAINLARMVLRQEPIGTDRNHDRYWVFTGTTPGLFVEKGWMGEEVNYKVPCPPGMLGGVASDSEDDSTPAQTGTTPLKVVYKTKRHILEKSKPHPGQNLWFIYPSQKALDGLLKSLHPQGIRESLLKKEIKDRYDDILRVINKSTRMNLALRDSDGEKELLEGFKKELLDMELRLRNGGLGGVPHLDKFEAQLQEGSDISVLGGLLLEVKSHITEKFLQGFMLPVVKEEPIDGEEEEEERAEGEEEDEKPSEKEHKREKAVREWGEAVESCQTMSRLHVLLAILDTCIKWEKSAENAKCKICRKKGDDGKLLLCDECNQAFHMYCLRPALTRLPTGDWFCPACKPRTPQARPTELGSDSEEDDEEKETACRECSGTDKLITCSKCPAAFHTTCHNPPMRHAPRSGWECMDCKSGVNSGRRKGKLSRRAAPRRNYRQVAEPESEEDSDDEEEEEESEEEEEDTRSSRRQSAKSSSRSKDSGRRQAKVTPSSSRGNNSARSARNSRGAADSDMGSTPTSRNSRRGPSELSLCEDILQKVMKNKNSWPFLEPVDKREVPDYHVLIKKPMDFQTMQKKCARLSYASPQEFIEDAALVFENAESYNTTDSEVYTCMLEVEKQLKDLLSKVLPDWPYYRTVMDKSNGSSSNDDSGRRSSRNK